VSSDGTVLELGRNDFGVLGDTSLTAGAIRRVPAPVSGISDVVAVAAGEYHSLALRRDGTVWAWGWNIRGELGDGTNGQRTARWQVSGLTSIVAIAAGSNYSVALKADGTVWRWGSDWIGWYGNVPGSGAGLMGVTAIATASTSRSPFRVTD
jgi:alpha-tubulin suppressor-like RCC1 family protein